MNYPYTLSNKTFTVYIDGRVYQTDRSNPNWDRIKEAVNEENPDPQLLIWLVQPVNGVKAALAGEDELTVQSGSVFYGSEQIHGVLAERLLDIMSEGLSLDPWVRFVKNLFANPQDFARGELYEFLEKSDLPITPDGCFIAYKIVREDYRDEYSGQFDNSIGRVVTMNRDDVDPNRFRTCSAGLHFCSKGYLPHYGSSGSRVVLVKINPADVVSIPNDYDNAKGRTWRYEVVGEISREDAGLYTWKPVVASYDVWSFGYDPSVDDDYEYEDNDDDYEVRHVSDEEMAEINTSVYGEPAPIDPEFQRLLDEEEAIEAAVRAEREANEQPVVESVAHGTITRQRFTELREQHGSLNKMAKALGQSAGTIQAWKTKLFGKANS